ncbi:hypothetical protein EZ428_22555 [Pedobacter frigiditerrae]|uniref:Uncharacterized protein n=1 Tax=Pedobacter frigiditerrae TaxID=2530452 RepID=A0A4R0MK67_9SPHI|nr:hypothetical protein [Pedobacter frigiditerrae]TCC86989.1 hypothetical protein EZ428_22555 [Pedobacter frigiditerrae]
MTKQEQIHRWLIIGFQQPADRLSEIFYYDKRDNEFFSILVVDYFMLDENFDITPAVTTVYSAKTSKIIAERIKRIENDDSSILALPRLGSIQNVDDDEFIPQRIDSFLNLNAIDVETVKIWEVEEEGIITIDLKRESEPLTKKTWWKLWR